MLALRSAKNEIENEMEKSYSSIEDENIMDFAGGINLLDSIDFDDLFVGINDGDLLPDLEMDPREILADFSCGEESMSDVNVTTSMVILFGEGEVDNNNTNNNNNNNNNNSSSSVIIEMGKTGSGSISDLGSGSTSPLGSEEAVSNKDFNPSPKEGDQKGRKSTKNPHGKRKVKVDWTPELHRRFVQAVEQLGVDKAVPSRILELMGIDCLTRHNIASHLQKYRSHRKHLLAREAEAASWSQRRQVYGGGGAAPPAGKRPHHWIPPPTMGFPHFRPLHVWGHPSVDQSMMPMWPPPPPHHPPADHHPPYWVPHHHHHHHHVPTPGTPCFPPQLQRFPAPPPVHGIPPTGMYKLEQAPRHTLPQPPADLHPSKESVDAAIGDVLSKPWLPLPLGLKPPSVDSVMVELQRQGIPKIPPTCA